MAENLDKYQKKSGLWFLLPIFFSIIGGIIAYFAIRDSDPNKAKNCLFLGIVLFGIPFAMLGIMAVFFSLTLSEMHPIFDVPIYEI